MKKNGLAVQLARQTGVSKAAAADQLDQVVHNILTNLRRGQSAALPGLGTFLPGPKPAFQFDSGMARKGKRGRRR